MTSTQGLPWHLNGKESVHQCKRWELDLCVGKILWRRKWQPPSESLPGTYVFADSIELLHFWLESSMEDFGIDHLVMEDFAIDHLVMSMCRVISCVIGRGCLLWPVCSFGKTLLAIALLHFVIQGQSWLLLQIFLDFLFFHSSLQRWKGHLFWFWF